MAAFAIIIIITPTFAQRGKKQYWHSLTYIHREGALAMVPHLGLKFKLNSHQVRKP